MILGFVVESAGIAAPAREEKMAIGNDVEAIA